MLPEKGAIFNSYEEIILPVQKEGSFHLRIFLMDDLTENQKQNIKKTLNNTVGPGLIQTQEQFFDADSPLLKKISDLLLADQYVRLEIHNYTAGGIHYKPLASEKLSQQLAFYFRNKALNSNSFHSNASNIMVSAFKTDQTKNNSDEMIVEFIFMKNNAPSHD